MHLTRILKAALLALVLAVAVLVVAGCAARTVTSDLGSTEEVTAAPTDASVESVPEVITERAVESVPEPGVVLEYGMSGGAPVSYRFTSESTQTMDVQGQLIPMESAETLIFSVQPKGMNDGLYALGITIDDLAVSASSPRGEMEADSDGVVGRSFNMTLSKLGEEGGLPDPAELQYTLGTEGPKSVVTGFSAIFPDLPSSPVKVGDTWPARMEMVEQSDQGSVVISIDAVNTLQGLDALDGLECARITSVLTGTIKGSGTQQGVAWTMESQTEGTGTWYFAYEEGILVSDWTEGTSDGAIVVDAPDGAVTMPVTREFKMVTELVR